MPPVYFRFLFLLSLGPLFLIEQPIVKFFVDHCYFIVHFNHYSKRITSIQQIKTKQFKYVQITISPLSEWFRWLPWKHLGSSLRRRLGSWLLWNFRLSEAIRISWGHHFLSAGTLLLTIGCRGQDLELLCLLLSSILGYLCLFASILLLLFSALLLGSCFGSVHQLASNFRSRAERSDLCLCFYLVDSRFHRNFLFEEWRVSWFRRTRLAFLITF